MKNLFTLIAVSLAVVLLATTPVTYGQDRPAAPAADKVFSGQLAKVDASAKSISVKDGDKEMTFSYTDQTQIVGGENNIQGLTGKTGMQLKVSYREDRGTNLATKIEVVQK